jgi:hypothetical protein
MCLRLCLAANIPLVESGTAGYLGQVTVIRKVTSKNINIKVSFVDFIAVPYQNDSSVVLNCKNQTDSSVVLNCRSNNQTDSSVVLNCRSNNQTDSGAALNYGIDPTVRLILVLPRGVDPTIRLILLLS